MARSIDDRTPRGTCWVLVDLGAIVSNLRLVRAMTAPGTPVVAVVKANAYGHGSLPVSRALLSAGVDALGVATLDEAVELRTAGIDGRILVLGRMVYSELDEALRWHLELAVPEVDMAAELSRLAVRRGVCVPVHLKVDTGMTRLGIPFDQAPAAARKIHSLPGLALAGIFSHFANADLADPQVTDSQIERTLDLRAKVGDKKSVLFHLANSAAILTARVPAGTGVRPGIMLYGSPPSSLVNGSALAPALTWVSRVLQIHEVPKGTGVSYGHAFVTSRPSRIATVAAGYADGYRRCLTNRGQVLIRGKRAPVVGRVCMDMTMADVTDIPEAARGDEVVLIGSQGQDRISAEEMADLADTISYEIFCGISPRVPRYYTGQESGAGIQEPASRS